MNAILDNPVIVIPLLAWLVAETSKFALRLAHDPHAKFGDTGGMPSGHAAFVVSAATAIGLQQGPGSPLFGLAVVLVAIVIHDAIRLRWAVGQQAERLNALIKKSGRNGIEPVVVWRGHRIREVAAGGVLGAIVSYLLYQALYA